MSRQSTPRQPTPRHDQESLVRGMGDSLGAGRVNASKGPSRPSRFVVQNTPRVPPTKVEVARLVPTETQDGRYSVVGHEAAGADAAIHTSLASRRAHTQEAYEWLVDRSNGNLPSNSNPFALLVPDGMESHVSARQLASACEMLLGKLHRHPNDGRLDLSFFEGTQEFKYIPPERWAKWPFVEVESEKDNGRVFSQPPGEMEPAFFVRHTGTTIEIGWQEYKV